MIYLTGESHEKYNCFFILVFIPKMVLSLDFVLDGEIGSEGSAYGFFKYPQGMAIDEKNRELHIIDNGNKRIQIFSLSSLKPIGMHFSNKYFYPIDLALDSNGNSYISDYGDQIVVLDGQGTDLGVISMLPTGSRPSPSGVYFDKVNNVLVVAGSPTEKGRISVWMNRQLYRFWSATNPYDVWVSSQSLIYSAEWDHISVYNYNGSIVSRIPTDYGVVGITGDNKGIVFVTYYYSAKVDAYLVANGLKVGTYKFPLHDTPAQPYSGHHFDLVYDPQGYLFVTNRSKHSVSRLKIQGSQLVTASISAANKTYDGTTGATTTCTLVGVAVGDTVTCSATNANFADANVGNSKTVTATGIILAGSSMAKYTLTNTTASTKANITPAAATVRLSNLTQTFTGKALTPIATTTPSGLSVTWVGAPQTNAGTYPVSATVNNPNYQQSSASGSFIISKATQP